MSNISSGKTTVAIRRLVPALVGTALLLKVVLTAATPLRNPDTYFHLRFGFEFTHGWRPWNPGHLDRFGTADWVPTQWLSQVGMYAVESVAGLGGIAILAGALMVALLLLWYRLARRESDPLVAMLVTSLAFVGASASISARPQLLSFILGAVVMSLWLHAGERRAAPWLLIPLVYLWAMLHGMWIVGVILSFAAAGALILDRRLPARVLAVPTLAFISAFVTPAGPRLPAAVLQVNGRSDYFSEWAAPSVLSLPCLAALTLSACVLIGIAVHRSTSVLELAMLASGLTLALYSQRTLPVAVAVLAPFAARRLQLFIGSRADPDRRERYLARALPTVAILSIVLAASVNATTPPPIASAFKQEVAHLPRDTPLLTVWEDGGPMLWAEPRLIVPIHGYADLYTDDELAKYSSLLQRSGQWEETLSATGIKYAILPAGHALVNALLDIGWTIESSYVGRLLLQAEDG